MSEKKKGFTCACGHRHEFPLYVYSHWNELLVFTCPECNRDYDVLRGYATPRKQRKAKAKQ